MALVAACGDPGFAPPTPGGGEDPVTVPVEGVVYDSVTGAPLAGVTVAIQGLLLTTAPDGRYTGEVGIGTSTVSVATAGYERFSRPVTVVGPTVVLDLPLRRLAPYPLRCELNSGGFNAILVDLQGRKAIERWSQSTLTLVTPSGRRTIGARAWGYTPLDTYRSRVTIADADPGTLRADWMLYDIQGDLFSGSCEPSRTSIDTTTS